MKLPKDINTPKGRAKFLKGKTILAVCCFCSKGMKKSECSIIVDTDKDEKKFITWQMFWCHRKCFEEALHKNIRCEFVLGDKK